MASDAAYSREWKRRNRHKMKEWHRRWLEKNRDHMRAWRREYYAKTICGDFKRYCIHRMYALFRRLADPEKEAFRSRDWAKRNPQRRAEIRRESEKRAIESCSDCYVRKILRLEGITDETMIPARRAQILERRRQTCRNHLARLMYYQLRELALVPLTKEEISARRKQDRRENPEKYRRWANNYYHRRRAQLIAKAIKFKRRYSKQLGTCYITGLLTHGGKCRPADVTPLIEAKRLHLLIHREVRKQSTRT